MSLIQPTLALALALLIAMTNAAAEPPGDIRARLDADFQADLAVCKELGKSEAPSCIKEATARKKAAYAQAWKNRDPARQARVYYGNLNANKPTIEKDYKSDLAFCRELDKASSATCQREALDRKKQALKSVMTVPREPPQSACPSCGTITAVREVEKPGQGSLIGQISGGVVGGAIGNQIGSGSGRTLATIAGAVGGALAGNEIEKRIKAGRYHEVSFRLNNGEEKTITFDSDSHGFKAGDKIRFENNQLVHQP